MRATGVIVRFLSLLDVALILLGMLMIALMQSQSGNGARRVSDASAELANVDFVYLFAGWEGPQEGKCFVLTPERKLGREVSTETADDIRDVLANRQSGNANHLVMLLFSDDGWDRAWDRSRLERIERIWNLKVVPVYNVHLAQ